MSYKIVIDSCGELLDEWKKDPRFESVALTLSVGGENIIDDEAHRWHHDMTNQKIETEAFKNE